MPLMLTDGDIMPCQLHFTDPLVTGGFPHKRRVMQKLSVFMLTFVPVQKLCVNIYIYMQFLYFYMSSAFFVVSLVTFGIFLNNTLILCIWCFTIPDLPGCFGPWTFFQNIEFNMVPSDPFMSHLATQLGYSAGEFQALQLIVLATFGVVD